MSPNLKLKLVAAAAVAAVPLGRAASLPPQPTPSRPAAIAHSGQA